MTDRAEQHLARLAEALGVAPEDLVRAALEGRFAEEADARAARQHARAVEREPDVDEGELWSETLAEQSAADDEVDLWWSDPPPGRPGR